MLNPSLSGRRSRPSPLRSGQHPTSDIQYTNRRSRGRAEAIDICSTTLPLPLCVPCHTHQPVLCANYTRYNSPSFGRGSSSWRTYIPQLLFTSKSTTSKRRRRPTATANGGVSSPDAHLSDSPFSVPCPRPDGYGLPIMAGAIAPVCAGPGIHRSFLYTRYVYRTLGLWEGRQLTSWRLVDQELQRE